MYIILKDNKIIASIEDKDYDSNWFSDTCYMTGNEEKDCVEEHTARPLIVKNEIYFADEVPQEVLLKEQLAKTNIGRDIKEEGGFEFEGKEYDSDLRSCVKIIGAAVCALVQNLNGEPLEFEWTTKDNQQVTLDTNAFLRLLSSLIQHSNNVHVEAVKKKERIRALLDSE